MIFELAQDFSAVLAAMSAKHPKHRVLCLLEEAIRRDIHFITRHPSTLFQCLWNSCWWYNCPEAAKHYEVPEGGWPLGEPSWEQPGPKLYKLLESWRSVKEKKTPGFYWMRSLRPPPTHLDTAQIAIFCGHEGSVNGVAVSPCGRHIISGSSDKTVRMWDVKNGNQIHCLRGHNEEVTSVTYSPNGKQICSGSQDNTIRIWDAECLTELRCLRGHEDAVLSIKYSPDGRRIISGSKDKTVRVWDVESGLEIRCFHGHKGWVSTVAVSPDGQRVVSGAIDDVIGTNKSWFTADCTVWVWDIEDGKEIHCLNGHMAVVTSVAYSPDGRLIVSGSRDKTIRVWDAKSGAQMHCLRGHNEEVTSVAYSTDGKWIASGAGKFLSAWDNTVRIWDAESGALLRCLSGHQGEVSSVVVFPHNQQILTGSSDKTVRLWNPKRGKELRHLREEGENIGDVVCSTDGRRIVTLEINRFRVRIWDAENGVELCCLQEGKKKVSSVAVSPDGELIATVFSSLLGHDSTVRVLDAKTGAELQCLRGCENDVRSVLYSPNGRQIVTYGGYNKPVQVWDSKSVKELCYLRVDGNNVKNVAYSADGRQIISISTHGWICGGPSTIQVWDAESGTELRRVPLHGHKPWVKSVAYSADKQQIVLVSGIGDRSLVQVFDAEDGSELHCLQKDKGAVYEVAFSPDSTRIATCNYRTVRVWDAKTGRCIDLLEGSGDVSAIAAGISQFLFRALTRGIETAVEDVGTAKSVAWFPETLRDITTYPSGITWAGSVADHLYIVTLEGGDVL